MRERPEFRLRFADGERLSLGPRTLVMGVLNVTPDSFSDGGRFPDPGAAVEAGLRLVEEGADLLDIGGESTRPAAEPVEPGEEERRIVPVIEGLRRQTRARISVDTRRAAVAVRALDAGADVVNDVSALGDPEMAGVVAAREVPVVLMHMRGEPRTMQDDTRYDNVIAEVVDFLRERVQTAISNGVADDRIVVDPGIGFGKSATGSLTLLRELPALQRVGRPILIGASRKSFIGASTGQALEERLEASLAIAAYAASVGAHVVRVHDVAATRRAVDIVDAMRQIGS